MILVFVERWKGLIIIINVNCNFRRFIDLQRKTRLFCWLHNRKVIGFNEVCDMRFDYQITNKNKTETKKSWLKDLIEF